MRVLIVDDESYVLDGLKNMIRWEDLGIDEIVTSRDGRQAWELFQSRKPDLLLTDIYMPGMNGLELVKLVRQQDADVPVVILSGYGEFSYAKEAIQLNVSQYILKPAVFMEIETVLKEVLNDRRASQKKEQYLRELRSRLEQSLPILREQLLFDMLTGGVKEKDLSDTRLDFYGLPEEVRCGGLVASLLLHRGDSRKTGTESDWQLFKFAASNIAREIVGRLGRGQVLRYMEDRLILFMYGADKIEVVERARQAAAVLTESIASYLELNASVGIGRWYPQISRYALSYQQSRDVLQRAEYEEYKHIFDAEEPDCRLPPNRLSYPMEQIRLISDAIRKIDCGQLMRIWSETETLLFNVSPVSLDYLKVACVGIGNSAMMQLTDTDPALMDIGETAGILANIQSAPNRKQLQEQMRALIGRLKSLLETKYGAGRENAYIQHIKAVVEKNYGSEIAFARIAEELHLSRTYLSGLFKRVTGETFMNYLTLYRLEKAKELLRARRYMVYEVSTMVGYSDPTYFSRVFKQITGASPSEYSLEEERG